MNTKATLLLFGVSSSIILASNFEYLGTKQPYNFEKSVQSSIPKGYEQFFINHLGRHGSRHLSSPKYDISVFELLSIAQKDGSITKEGLKLKEAVAKIIEIEKGNYGLLTKIGIKEQTDLAKRFYNNNKDIFGKDVIASSTYVERAQQSRDAFLTELQKYISSTKFKVSTNSKKDEILRFYDLSPEYDEFVDNGSWKKDVENYAKSKNFDNEVLEKLFSKKFINKLENGEFKLKDAKGKTVLKNPTDAVRNIYDLYIIQSNIGIDLGIGALFSKEQLKWYEEVDNLYDFYEKGPGKSNEDISTKIALPLLKDFILTSEEAIQNKNISANLRFAHAETMIPFISLLEINGMSVKQNKVEEVYKTWLGRDVSGMSTNVQWLFYKNSEDETIVKILHNEKEATLPIKTSMKPYYKWNDVKSYYEAKLGGE
ncbi:MAG: histidine-type phosphatase [Cetobacterium sp.]